MPFVQQRRQGFVGRWRIGRASMFVLVIGAFIVAAFASVESTAHLTRAKSSAAPVSAPPRAVLDRYCITCHNQKLRTAGLALDTLDVTRPHANAEVWERVIAKLRARSMPPAGRPRPDVATYHAVAGWLETEIDRAWDVHPNPGRIGAVHRLNRAQYKNAIRDLFTLDVDVKSRPPGDEPAAGSFDNFADVLTISTAHLERYLSVARQVTRLAIGLPSANPGLDRFEIPWHVVQDDQQSEDLPFGSRGGTSIRYDFPVDGEYLIKVRLRRQYQDYIMGMGWPQQLDVRLDGKLLKRFTVGGAAPGRPAASSYAGDGQPGFAGDDEWEKYMQITADAGLEVRVPVKAGPRSVGVSFVRELWEPEGLPQPLQRARVLTNDQIYMGYASVGSVQIGGPYTVAALGTDTPGRRAIFVCEPRLPERLNAVPSRLPERLNAVPSRLPERLNDLEVASRLSFFLWNSIPDDRLITLAEQGQLTRPSVLDKEVRRMLADQRATRTLVDDFAAQWLNLRRVEEVVVDPVRYPNYDESLLQAFKRETELFVASTLSEDRSVADLLKANYTFVNERLARHYGISGVYGSRFRRVALSNPAQRGGLLGNGALLATTSYPDRTSPVLRGKWLLDNIFGIAVPPPPANVDTTLPETEPGALPPSIRDRLAQHRKNPAGANWHSVIDPMGFTLENFDGIGGWRTVDESGTPGDASGVTAGGWE